MGFQKTANFYTFTLNKATVMFAETLDNYQYFDEACHQKPKLRTELQPRKLKDRNVN
jgi:hypothetical protein